MAAATTPFPRLWTVAGGSPCRAGTFPEPVRFRGKPLRHLETRGAVQAAVVFDADDRAFVADMAGQVQAFDSQGGLLWHRQLEGGVSATPAVDPDNHRLFAGTHFGWVYALRTTDGSVLWRQRLPTTSDARILSDLLYLPARARLVVSSWGGQFRMLAGATGEIGGSWNAGLAPQAAASADPQGNIFCLRAVRGEGVTFVRVATDGTETALHRVAEGARNAARMVVAAAPVIDAARAVAYFIANIDRDSELFSWSLAEARLWWHRRIPRMIVATPALRPDGAIVVADTSGVVEVVAASGESLAHKVTGADYFLAGPVCDGAGIVFVGDPCGVLHALDVRGVARRLFEAPRSLQARPAFDQRGNLYLPCTNRRVYVFANCR
jgi:outer membrane protein assembly factor BamB